MGWIRSIENIADAMAKKATTKPLKNLTNSGSINLKVEQWVFRREHDFVSQLSPSERDKCHESMKIHYTNRAETQYMIFTKTNGDTRDNGDVNKWEKEVTMDKAVMTWHCTVMVKSRVFSKDRV